jgi:hypothetical protein
MGRSRTWFVTAPQIVSAGELAPILMRLMLSVNDLAVCAQMLDEWAETTVSKKMARKAGARMYFVRLTMSHVYEALRIIKIISQTPRFRAAVYECDGPTIEAFETVEQFTKSKEELDMLDNFRNKVGFHYDWSLSGETLREVADHDTTRASVWAYSMGTEPLDWHFELADAVMDRMIVRKIFGLDQDRSVERTAKTEAIAMRQQEIARKYTDFAAHFVRHHSR